MYSSYSSSGIGHLLAVSGLHVGFIVTLLSLFISMFKANKKVRFYVITTILFFYAFICGFSVSVTRAFIMTAVLLYSKSREVEYDSLSSLCFAGLILLIVNPLNAFDVGFILSFSSVASIILFARPIRNFFNKFLGDKLASALAISVSVTIGTTLPTAAYFAKLSIFSVVTNVIVIPIASLAYMFMFVSVIFALIIPPLGVFVYLFEFLMSVVTGISSLTGAITFASVNFTFVFIFGLLLIISAMFASDYLFIERRKRVVFTSCSALLAFLSLVAIFIC